MIDIDDFKQINDREGHAAGDLVLVHVAQTIKRDLRGVDLVARYGGEEFAVVLPETPLQGATVAGERIREQVARANEHVTVSVGAAEGADADILGRADAAMYQAKRTGKNRVVSWQPGMTVKS
jgi:diguanylate cyclase (GGDEF)-like protein